MHMQLTSSHMYFSANSFFFQFLNIFFHIQMNMFNGREQLNKRNNGLHYQFDYTTDSDVLYQENYVKMHLNTFIV